MNDIGPGDWVECVDDTLPPDKTVNAFAKGQLYCVEIVHTRKVICKRDGCGNTYFKIGGRWGVCPNRFRPIHRRSAFDTSALLENIPAELEPA